MAQARANAVALVFGMARHGLGAPILLIVILAMVVLPLPPVALDILFTFNISLALVVLLVSVYAARPLDFSVFPTVLLVATLLRLALNIASTRVVLLHGHKGTDAAGRVIEAFGEFVIGGDYAVGLVVFAILVIINFVVVTKGATRVSEVSARFTLDAMPGKQMAIDADLNAGLIDQNAARARRAEVVQESDFYGSMDGASKFVRGDAVAAILILFINILGGLAVGVVQHDLSFAHAAQNYTLLTVGDGLVAQVPAILLSTAAGITVTRVSAEQDMSREVLSQLFTNPKALAVTAGIVGFMGLIPGMPNLAFLILAGVAALAAYKIAQRRRAESQQSKPQPIDSRKTDTQELTWDDVPSLDAIGLEVGYRLIALVDKKQGGEMLARIKGVRRRLSQELGFLVPAVHVRDNLELPANTYRVTLKGVIVASVELQPDRELAINPGQAAGKIPGVAVKDPVFRMDAVWIKPGQRQEAQSLGYTVVDCSTVVATHLNQLLLERAHELLGHEEVQQLLDKLADRAPKLVEDLVPKTLPLRAVVKVLQNLLRDQVPIRDMRTIMETLAEHADTSRDADVLTSQVRARLGRLIVQQICGQADEVPVVTLDPALEQILQTALQTDSAVGPVIEPGLAGRMQSALFTAKERGELAGQPAILLVPAVLWPAMARFVRRTVPDLKVLSYDEMPDDKRIRIIATVGA